MGHGIMANTTLHQIKLLPKIWFKLQQYMKHIACYQHVHKYHTIVDITKTKNFLL